MKKTRSFPGFLVSWSFCPFPLFFELSHLNLKPKGSEFGSESPKLRIKITNLKEEYIPLMMQQQLYAGGQYNDYGGVQFGSSNSVEQQLANKPYEGSCQTFSIWIGIFVFIIALVVVAIGTSVYPLLVAPAFIALLTGLFALGGFITVQPNQAVLVLFCGKYLGSIQNFVGITYINPMCSRIIVPTAAQNFESSLVKCNDKIGNPILIKIVVAYKIENAYSSRFLVTDYNHFIRIQSEAAMRHIATKYPYDNFFEDDPNEITLRGGTDHVNHDLIQQVQSHVSLAGIRIFDVKITELQYSNEIAAAMLKVQEATAVVGARRKIVEGAVKVIEETFTSEKLRNMRNDKKMDILKDLLTVLISGEHVQPVLSAGIRRSRD